MDPLRLVNRLGRHRPKEAAVWKRFVEDKENPTIHVTNYLFYTDPTTFKQTSLTGIHAIISDVFARHSNVFEVMWRTYRKLRKSGVISPPSIPDVPIKGVASRGYGPSMGKNRGIMVHQQLADVVILTGAQFNRKYSDKEPWMLSIRDTIKNHPDNWKMVLPERTIAMFPLGFGTPVDMICMNAKGKFVLLEFKTGTKGYFTLEHPTRFFTGFLGKRHQALPFSLKNMAKLQLWLAMIILHVTYGIPYGMMEGYVIHAESGDPPFQYRASTGFARDNEQNFISMIKKYREKNVKSKDTAKKKKKKKKSSSRSSSNRNI